MIAKIKLLFLSRFFLSVVIPIIIFWILLCSFGYPLPFRDDLFFIGAAINLATEGVFKNSYIFSPFYNQSFYLYTPFHSYVLAAWLSIFGVSTVSILAFQCSCYASASIAIAYILKGFNLPNFITFAPTVFIALFMQEDGLRPEALAMSLLFFGVLLLRQNKIWTYFVGFTFVGCAVFTQPTAIAYAVPMCAGIIGTNSYNKQNFNIKYLLRVALPLIAALSIVIAIFLLCIKFELPQFTQQFTFNSQVAGAAGFSPRDKIQSFMFIMFGYYGYIVFAPSWFLLLFLLVKSINQIKISTPELNILILSLTTGIIFHMLLHPRRGFMLFFCWLTIIVILGSITRSLKSRNIDGKSQIYLLSAFAILCLILSQSLSIVSLIGSELISKSYYSEVSNLALLNPDRQFFINHTASRFVFDYKMPKNTISWVYHTDVPPQLKDNYIYIANPYINVPNIEVFGKQFKSSLKKPFDIVFVDAQKASDKPPESILKSP